MFLIKELNLFNFKMYLLTIINSKITIMFWLHFSSHFYMKNLVMNLRAQGPMQLARLILHCCSLSLHVSKPLLHVSRFPGHVPTFPSHVAKFLSHVVKFASHVAKFPSNVAKFPSHVAKFPSRIAKFPSHVAKFPSHVAKFPLYIAKFPSLALKSSWQVVSCPWHIASCASSCVIFTFRSVKHVMHSGNPPGLVFPEQSRVVGRSRLNLLIVEKLPSNPLYSCSFSFWK
jgi:hypothetical protein